MNRCPACNARLKVKRVCRRCNTDLASLLDLKITSYTEQKKAVSAYDSGNYTAMLAYAKRSLALVYTPETAKLLAMAAILNKKYDLALAVWRTSR